MLQFVSVRSALLLALTMFAGLATTATPAHAQVVVDGVIDEYSPVNPRGLRPGSRFDLHRVALKAGVRYVIEMNSNNLDAYLFLVGRNVLIFDDDGGGGLNARIVFTPQVDATFIIYATTYRIGERGTYQLTVRPLP